jgi:hypothetical protein
MMKDRNTKNQIPNKSNVTPIPFESGPVQEGSFGGGEVNEEEIVIHQEHIDLVLKRIELRKLDPTRMLDWNEASKKLRS